MLRGYCKNIRWIVICVLCVSLLLVGCNYENNLSYDERGETTMVSEALEFYPEHPSGMKTHKIETKAMPILGQEAPFDMKVLYEEYTVDADSFFEKYVDNRFEVTGIAKKFGPDVHNKPSIEISDSVDGQTCALVIFPTDDHYSKVAVGDIVTVWGNYLVMSNWFGTVMKYSELVSVEKANA